MTTEEALSLLVARGWRFSLREDGRVSPTAPAGDRDKPRAAAALDMLRQHREEVVAWLRDGAPLLRKSLAAAKESGALVVAMPLTLAPEQVGMVLGTQVLGMVLAERDDKEPWCGYWLLPDAALQRDTLPADALLFRTWAPGEGWSAWHPVVETARVDAWARRVEEERFPPLPGVDVTGEIPLPAEWTSPRKKRGRES